MKKITYLNLLTFLSLCVMASNGDASYQWQRGVGDYGYYQKEFRR